MSMSSLLPMNVSATYAASERDYFSYNVTSFVGSLAMALLCLLGFYGNAVSAVIFSRPPMRSSINMLLCGVSVIDLAVLLSSIPVFLLPSLDQYVKINYVSDYYSFSILVVYPLAMMARSSSVWTFVLISVERYYAVCFPLEVNKTMTAGRAKVAQITVIVLSLFYNLIRFWEYQPNERFIDNNSDHHQGGQVHWKSADRVVPLLRANRAYFMVYYSLLYLLTNFLAPFIIILLLHAKILRDIRRAYEDRRRMNGRQRRQYRTSRMIIVVTVLFGFCNVFAFALSIWEMAEPGLFELGDKRTEHAYLLLDVSNVAVLINSSITFVVFLVYCRKYRKYFLWYFRCRCWSTKGSQVDTQETFPLAGIAQRPTPSITVRNYGTLLKVSNGNYKTPSESTFKIGSKLVNGTVESDKEMDALLPTQTPPDSE